MPKRTPESSSSPSFRDGESSESQANGNSGSHKKARNGSAGSEQGEASPMASTSTQLPPEQRTEVAASQPQIIGIASSSSAADEPSQPEMRKSKRVSIKVRDPEEDERYYEGCLVMGRVKTWPSWPGMIRREYKGPHHNDQKRPQYLSKRGNYSYYCVQFFDDITEYKWLVASDLRVYDPARDKPLSKDREQDVIRRHAKGMKIINAASKHAVEDRLAKFALPLNTSTDNLLKEIDECNSQNARDESSSPSPRVGPIRLRIHSVVHDGNELAPPVKSVQSNADILARLKKRMSDSLQKKDQEKEDEIKGLKSVNSKLTAELEKSKATVHDLTQQLHSKDDVTVRNANLEKKLKEKDNEILKLRANLKKMEKEKLDLEKFRSEVEGMIDGGF